MYTLLPVPRLGDFFWLVSVRVLEFISVSLSALLSVLGYCVTDKFHRLGFDLSRLCIQP